MINHIGYKNNHGIIKKKNINNNIKPLFKADQLEIDKIQEKWLDHLQTNKLNPMSKEGLQLQEMILNINFVLIEDSKEFKAKLREVRCKVCFGLCRLPGVFCSGCRRIYCKACIDPLMNEQGEYFKCPSGECTETVFQYLTDEMYQFIVSLVFVQC